IALALDRALAGFDPTARLTLLHRMQREQISVQATTLTEWLSSERNADCVAAILTALNAHPPASIRRHLAEVVRNSEHSLANRQAALRQFSAGIDASSAEELLALSRELLDGPVLAEALRRLVKYPQLAPVPLLTTKLQSAQPEVRAAAIEALGEFQQPVDAT